MADAKAIYLRFSIAVTALALLLGYGCGGNTGPADAKEKTLAEKQAEAERAEKEKSLKYRSAIIRVLVELDRIDKKYEKQMTFREKYISATAQMDKFIKELRGIDVSNCPEEFKASWLDCMHACEHRRLVEDQNTGVKGFIKVFTSGTNGIRDTENANARLKDSGDKLEKVALKYGVTSADAPVPDF